MSKEFIKAGYNSASIQKAVTQERQLNYILNSSLQDDRVDQQYLNQWAERNYQTSDFFLNWVKSIFKTENFLTFFKYLRYPLPSAKIIHNRIEPQLLRVFHAEDSDFRYDVKSKDYSDFKQDLNIKKFNSEMFEQLLYKHNSLIVSDLDPVIANKPYRYFIDISDVKSIKEERGIIKKIAFKGCINESEESTDELGFIVIDDKSYSFYNEKYELVSEVAHDLGYCPVHFISPKKVNGDFVVRESLFTYVRQEIEEFNFLKTLQKMTDVNGMIPVVSKVEASKQNEDRPTGQPQNNAIVGQMSSAIYNQNSTLGTGDLQPGTVHEIPIDAIRSDDGSINMDAVKNYLNFHYTPIEALEFINKRIAEVERSIVSTVVGDVLESNESAKNEDQIAKSVSILENTLRSFAEAFNRIRKLSDYDQLALKYGTERVNEVFIHYGTDFFLESQSSLFDDLAKAPNALERKNIIVRISNNRYKNNADQLSRQQLLYDLMPFVSDKDFSQALELDIVSAINKDYQLRFNYWIDQFEALYGDIVTFYKVMDNESKAERLVFINNIITELIKNSKIESIKDQENDKIPLAQKIGVGGTQSLQMIITDPNMSDDQKANTLRILFNVPTDDAILLSTNNKKVTDEKSNLVENG